MENYDEISLKELILILYSGLRVIITFFIVSILIALVVIFGFNPVSQSSSLTLQSTLPNTFTTTFGVFNNPLRKIEDLQFLATQNELLQTMQIDASTVNVRKVSDTSFELTLTHPLNHTRVIDLDTYSTTLNDFIAYRLQTLAHTEFSEQLRTRLELLDQELALSNQLLDLYQAEIKNVPVLLSSYVMNPEYEILSQKLVNARLSSQELTLKRATLDQQVNALSDLNFTYTSFENFQTSAQRLTGISLPTFPINKTYTESPRFQSLLTLAIAAVLGLMLGVFVVFFTHYWKSA
jgi:LPS O-antigen subunit length determinant protein (WzzB/FepE family)